jgi:tetratricopeptide (TPR) repeat protein
MNFHQVEHMRFAHAKPLMVVPPLADAKPLAVVPPLGAYRRDLARLGVQRLSADDGAWIAAAVALAQLPQCEAAYRAAQEQQLVVLLDAVSSGMDAPPLDAPWRRSPLLVRRARVLAERMEEASAWHLALSVLAATTVALSPDALDAGRIHAQRARIQWKSGAQDDAESSYRQLVRDGRRRGEPELVARGYVGLASVNQVRGNFPALTRWANRARVLTERESFADLHALAHQLLMVSAGKRGRYGQALAHGWAAFRTAEGDAVREAEMLLNLAQLLVEMREYHAALTGFVAALEREPPVRIALPAWGGVATSASHLGEQRIARVATEHIELVTMVPGLEYARTFALAEAALGLERLGLDGGAARRAALALADKYQFHEPRFLLTAPSAAHAGIPAPRRVAERGHGRADASTAVMLVRLCRVMGVRPSHLLAEIEDRYRPRARPPK